MVEQSRQDGQSTPERQKFNFCRTEREKIFLSEEAVWLTTVYASVGTNFRLVVDPFFKERGFVAEPTGLLIDQVKTKESWGRPAGFTPEEFLADFTGEALGVCPSNAGWQHGAFWVQEGRLITPEKTLQGFFDVVGLDSANKWFKSRIEVENGQAKEDVLDGCKIGFSFPLIVEEGRVVPTAEIIGDPRLVADLRNVVDFAAGKKLPNDFWVLLRKLLPSTRVAGKRMLSGRNVVVSREGAMDNEELTRFQEIIVQNELSGVIRVDERKRRSRLALIGELPLQKIPVVGVGFNHEGNLMITAVDGRQPGSAGVTIEQLGAIMKDRGAICAGLGCAGGDVAVVLKRNDSFDLLNSPSNLGAGGERVTRRVPSLLVLS